MGRADADLMNPVLFFLATYIFKNTSFRSPKPVILSCAYIEMRVCGNAVTCCGEVRHCFGLVIKS